MNMCRIKKVCIDLILLLILSTSLISGQVVTVPSSYPVIDLSALEPLGVVLSSNAAAIRCTTMNQQKPSNSEILGATLSDSGENGTWNAKMSIKYQVMRANHTVGATHWAAAWSACNSYKEEDGKAGTWRLPTQRELQMIWILHPQLIGKGGFTAFTAGIYWSATEYNATNVWYMSFIHGLVDHYRTKERLGHVRCVRDL